MDVVEEMSELLKFDLRVFTGNNFRYGDQP